MTQSESINKFAQNFRILKRRCAKYKNDSDYVYKLARDVSSKKDKSRKWLIVMKKTKNTRTNECRKDVFDDRYAHFRASELEVIKIINIKNPKLTKQYVINEYFHTFTRYEVGKIVKPDMFDENPNNICSGGIHYFKKMIRAYYYELPSKYSEFCVIWFDCGRKYAEGKYLNGKEIGIWTYWYEIGGKCSEGEYLDGIQIGNWTYWRVNGEIELINEKLDQ